MAATIDEDEQRAVDGRTARRERGRVAVVRLLTQRALRPGPMEVAANPASRSARLRAAERIAA